MVRKLWTGKESVKRKSVAADFASTQTVLDARVLAGRRVGRVKGALGTVKWFVEEIRQGLRPSDVDCLFEHGFQKAEVKRLVISPRTLKHREENHQRLTTEESERLVRVMRITGLAEDTFGGQEKAGKWLRRPRKRLDDSTPLDLLDTEIGARMVEDLLLEIAHGMHA